VTVCQLPTDFKKACDPVRRKVLYNILTEFGTAMKRAGLIKVCGKVEANKEKGHIRPCYMLMMLFNWTKI
jgi:hypothetical protein